MKINKLILILMLSASACSTRREERREERAEERHEERREERKEERQEERREERRKQRRRERHRPERPVLPVAPVSPVAPAPPVAQPRATPWTGILDPSRAIDWSTAGIPGGIPSVTTQCGQTLQPSPTGDDTQAIQTAVNSCSATSSSYVQLAAGTFHTTGVWYIPTYVVLRGMGADQTIIQLNGTAGTASQSAITLGGNPSATLNEPQFSHVMNITSQNSKGDTTITVAGFGQATPAQLVQGYTVWIAPLNDWFPQCAGYPDTVPSTSSCMNMAADAENGAYGGGSSFNMDGPYGANSSPQRGSGQMNLITNVNGSTITLEDPLVDSFRHPLQDWRANSPADVLRGFNQGQVIRPSSQTLPVPHVYAEYAPTRQPAPGFCLTGPNPPTWPTTGGTGNTVTVTETVPGIVSPNIPCQWLDLGPGTDSSPRLMYWVPNVNVALENLQLYGVNNFLAGPYETLVFMNNCLHCWIRGVEINRPLGYITWVKYSYHGQIEQNYYTTSWYHGSGTDSVLSLDSGTSGMLVENNIFERTPEAVFTDDGGSGNVIAYNYSLGNWGANGINNGTNTLLSHDAFPWFTLQEGNILSQTAEDGIHGGNALSTNFRNWLTGTTKICQPVSVTGLTAGIPTRPPVPTVTTNAPGSTSYSYGVQLVVGGAPSAPSVGASISGPTTLSSTTFNTITPPNVPNLYTLWQNGQFTSTTPPANGPTQQCQIFRCTTNACSAGTQISPVGGVPCDGVTPVQDTGQASTGLAIGGTGQGQSIIPSVAAICTPLAPNNTTAGANAWIAYTGVWPQEYGQFSLRHNDVGNVTGSQDMVTASTNQQLAERFQACAVCNPNNTRCVDNSSTVTCGGGGTSCPITTCGTARNFQGPLDRAFGFGTGAGQVGAWDTSLSQDTAFHCQNYYHALLGVEAGDCPSSTVLPPSFYLSSPPAWWGSAQWPPIGPDVTGGLPQAFGLAYNIPAKNCYENVMGGTDSTGGPFLTFNAARCYSSAPPPAVPTFSAAPSTIQSGGTATLSWTVTNATTVSIAPGIGSVALSGSQSVSPLTTTTYTLTATNANGDTVATTTVTVPQAPTTTLGITGRGTITGNGKIIP